MKVRKHRGSIEEAMLTAEEISATLPALAEYFGLEMHLYAGFADERIGWEATYIVMFNGYPVGFTDGPLEGV
jgi:hypothetical protein